MDNSNTRSGLTMQTDDLGEAFYKTSVMAWGATPDYSILSQDERDRLRTASKQFLEIAVPALQAENDKLRADAERLDTVRSALLVAKDNHARVVLRAFDGIGHRYAEAFNIAIDAARAATGDKG